MPRQIQYVHVCAPETHTQAHAPSHAHLYKLHTLIYKERRRGRKHQIKPSLSNPLTRVIKDTHGLLSEGLSPNLKHLNAEQLLPGFGFRTLSSPSGVLATAETQLSLPTD